MRVTSRIWLRRAYEAPSSVDGFRVLVDRLWPRGVTRVELRLDAWTRHLAPTDELRHWFDHDPARWEEFGARYRQELTLCTGPAADELAALVDRVRRGRVTLVFGARDPAHNNAVVLRAHLAELASSRRSACTTMPADT
jgi:uncharacterized protein YeaO (DUF488 family)